MIPFLARRKYLFLLLLYPLVGMGFAYCEATVTVTRYVMEWPAVDRAIPFLPWMVWPYTLVRPDRLCLHLDGVAGWAGIRQVQLVHLRGDGLFVRDLPAVPQR